MGLAEQAANRFESVGQIGIRNKNAPRRDPDSASFDSMRAAPVSLGQAGNSE